MALKWNTSGTASRPLLPNINPELGLRLRCPVLRKRDKQAVKCTELRPLLDELEFSGPKVCEWTVELCGSR
jgi:hypothetical protein